MSIDPGAQRLLDLWKDSGRPPIEQQTPAEARAAARNSATLMALDPPPVGDVIDAGISTPHGCIPVRVYRPAQPAAEGFLPALLYFHGGGYVIGDLDTHDALCRELAAEGCCAVVSVDYRLAPEHKFPAAVDDAIAAAQWLKMQASELGLDAERLAVGGDSAGGGLAAVLGILSGQQGVPQWRLQALIYPVCDLGMTHDSYRRNGEGYLLTRATMAYFRDQYLRNPADAEDWRASPLRAPDLRQACPAVIFTAEYDPLCDEGCEFAGRLTDAGVRVTHYHLPGLIHGFVTVSKLIPAASQTVQQIGDAMRSAWENRANAAG